MAEKWLPPELCTKTHLYAEVALSRLTTRVYVAIFQFCVQIQYGVQMAVNDCCFPKYMD